MSAKNIQRALSIAVLGFLVWHFAHRPDIDGGGAFSLLAAKEILYLVSAREQNKETNDE